MSDHVMRLLVNTTDDELLVALDGPAGTGKSTVARKIAGIMGAAYLDTGAMYRIAALAVIRHGISIEDFDNTIVQEKIGDITANLDIQISSDPDDPFFIFDGDNVSDVIRTDEITRAASRIATIAEVRHNLVELQRDIAHDAGRCIVEGRDIGTVVLKDAPTKIYLTADALVRAQRRHAQNIAQGYPSNLDEVLTDIKARDVQDSHRAIDPLKPADDAIIVDTTSKSIDDVVQIVVNIIKESAWEQGAGEPDWEALDAEYGIDDPIMHEEALCTVAIVGRPNVGKSTLTNRFLGRRAAVVEDHPGVTRDRVSYLAEWNGRRFWVQDTGGWDPDAKGIHAAIARQAEAAMDTADVIVFVVDTHVGITETDAVMAHKLQRADVPVILVANKFDSDNQYGDLAEFWSLGLGNPYPVSAQHGRGGADVLDDIVRSFPETPRSTSITAGPRRVALVGKPNVGKSSLLNKLAREQRSVVDNVAGTTVDPVDSIVQLDQNLWKFIDTAGLRKKVKTARGHEYYASLRTRSAIDAAEVCVLLIDSSEPITEQDQRILAMIIDAGKALVVAYNKWDLMHEDQRELLERDIEEQLAHISWARRINISAATGRAVHKLEPMLIEALDNWDRRIPTGQLNNWVRETIALNPPPMNAGRLPRVLFATQASTRPPVIVLFTTGFLDAGYRRYLERKFRETFGFEGTPVRIAVRVRERRERRK